VSKDSVLFRCGEQECALPLSLRDVHLLDSEYFFARSASHRELLGLAFVAGLGAPPLGRVLVTHRRSVLTSQLEGLAQALEDQRDLISWSYSFRFSEKPEASGGGSVAGFHVRGLHGFVTVQPSGYCHVTLSEVAPTGRGRLVEIIDMRVRKELPTDDWGVLSIGRRKADVGWFQELPRVIAWLKAQQGKDVQVLHV
jgi:hypothetical protein